MRVAIADQCAATFKGHLQPFVRIKRQTIGRLDPRHQRAVVRGQPDQRANAAIDMKPQPLAPAKRTDGGQIINRPGIRRARCGDYAGRAVACYPILSHHAGKGCDVHSEIEIGWHQTQRFAAQTQCLDRFLMRRMHLI